MYQQRIAYTVDRPLSVAILVRLGRPRKPAYPQVPSSTAFALSSSSTPLAGVVQLASLIGGCRGLP